MHESLAEEDGDAASEGGKGRAGMSLGKKALKKLSNAEKQSKPRRENRSLDLAKRRSLVIPTDISVE